MSKIKILYAVLSVLIIASIIFTYSSSYARSHFKCTALTEVKYKSQIMKIISHYSFDGDVGSLVVEGEVSMKDGNIFSFIIKNIFDVKHSNNMFYLTSNNVVTQPVNLESSGHVNEFLSQFFYKERKSIVFEFSPEHPDAYMVYLGTFPVGFCKE